MEVYDPDVEETSPGLQAQREQSLLRGNAGKADGPKYPELVLERVAGPEE